MFGIAIRSDDGELLFWCGGEIFSVHKEEAARIVAELDALNTIRSSEKQSVWMKARMYFRCQTRPKYADRFQWGKGSQL